MDCDGLAETLRLARIAYQTQLDGDDAYLICPDNFTVEILWPGEWDATIDVRVEGWTIALGEDNDNKLVRASGPTLGEAAEALRRAVDERAAKVRALLGGAP